MSMYDDNGCGCGKRCVDCIDQDAVECQWCTHYDSDPENIEDWYTCRCNIKEEA